MSRAPGTDARAWRAARMLPGIALLGSLLGLLLAQLVRDRWLLVQMFMYVPIWPVAALALLWDLVHRGRALPLRWALSLIAIASGGIALSLMWRPAYAPEGAEGSPELRVIQWNTQWGSGHGASSVEELVAALTPQMPDVLVLSEAPREDEFSRAWSEQHPNWFSASVRHPPFHNYMYRLTVVSRYPVELLEEWPLRTGHAALYQLYAEPRTLRILMVDLKSRPNIQRSRTLGELAEQVEQQTRAGKPIDLIVGDFNTPGHFLGFDALAAAQPGYRRAAMWSGQWRGTWPSRLALSPFDIDHVWVRNGIDVVSSRIFRSRASDHRGQLTRLRVK